MRAKFKSIDLLDLQRLAAVWLLIFKVATVVLKLSFLVRIEIADLPLGMRTKELEL